MKRNQQRAMKILLDARHTRLAALFERVPRPSGSPVVRLLSVVHPGLTAVGSAGLGADPSGGAGVGGPAGAGLGSAGSGGAGGAGSQFCLRLLQVMVWATEGRNIMSEMQCRSVLAEEDIVNALSTLDGYRNPVTKV
jgi:hypothetical protein